MNGMEQFTPVQRPGFKNFILIGIILFIMLIGILILPFFINPKAFYDKRDGKIYYGSKVLSYINTNEFKPIDYSVAVDCTRVYYNGNPVDFIDRKTFRNLDKGFYLDKNGLYYEKTSLYSKNKLAPLEGTFDKATFHSLGYQTSLFADKNHLYALDLFGDPPLKAVELPGLDIATVESLHNNWLRDKSKIYFDDWGKIKPCPEIDANSFVVLDYTVAKDKNKVYYITQGLKTDKNAATERANYAVLDGADAASFEIIKDKEYRDKNQKWLISREGEHVTNNIPEGRTP